MALKKISYVTASLKNLLRLYTNWTILGIDPTDPNAVKVTAAAPSQIVTKNNLLSIYLYHVAECPYYRNTPGPGNEVPNIPTSPMGLVLYYMVTAHHTNEDEDLAALQEQDLMGYALKTFHDVPVITDNTQVNSETVIDSEIKDKDNAIQIVLRPVPPEEAFAYWSAEESQAPSIAAYYEVRTIMLEPAEPKTFPGTVFHLGSYLVPSGAPQLASGQNVVTFELSTEAGGGQHRLDASPARVTPGAGGPADWPRNRLVLKGANLTAKRQSLLLRCSRWTEPVEASADPTWSIDIRPTVAVVDIETTVDPGSGALDLLPGIYSASVRVVFDQQFVFGQPQETFATSNEVAFMVTPRIESHGDPNESHQITVTLDDTFDLTLEELEGTIEVAVDGQTYEYEDAVEPSADGKFVITADTIIFQSEAVATTPGSHPFRLVVNGADSQPFWIEVTAT
jgi:hypothetical protein